MEEDIEIGSRKTEIMVRTADGKWVPEWSLNNGSSASTSDSTTSVMRPKQGHEIRASFPSLHVLKNILTMDAIQEYPKLSLLVFSALSPYIKVFSNRILHFTQLVEEYILDNVKNLKEGQTSDLFKKKI